MKLKMAEKSLFAILLRSPWWASFALAGLVGLASKALLPDAYVIYGALGGFPFVVVGCIAAWRQLRKPDPERLAQILQKAADQSWRDFGDALALSFHKQGNTVTRLTKGVADFKLDKGGRTSLVSARRWKAALHGVEVLRDLVAQKEAENIDFCAFVSLAEVTANAKAFAKQNSVSLIAGDDLATLLLS